ncbi:nuclear transport factor 2 family protein [Undibacterium sp. RuRC25W]|uniref:nuclear transport factor 2 family protein n=1 Tax=Undibacterium sp. RuRC25W TaxID=3413047 RepID=UPI003BF0F835
MPHETPIDLVQRQLDAYNARDIHAWLNTYAKDATQFILHGQVLAKGHHEIRARMHSRFSEPDLHAALLSRTSMANIVVDNEIITRNFPEGRGTIEMLCVYEIVDGLIQKASFASGPIMLDAV